jgi:hypothetical protein
LLRGEKHEYPAGCYNEEITKPEFILLHGQKLRHDSLKQLQIPLVDGVYSSTEFFAVHTDGVRVVLKLFVQIDHLGDNLTRGFSKLACVV